MGTCVCLHTNNKKTAPLKRGALHLIAAHSYAPLGKQAPPD